MLDPDDTSEHKIRTKTIQRSITTILQGHITLSILNM